MKVAIVLLSLAITVACLVNLALVVQSMLQGGP